MAARDGRHECRSLKTVASVLNELSFDGPVVLEVISTDPDRYIVVGHDALPLLAMAAKLKDKGLK